MQQKKPLTRPPGLGERLGRAVASRRKAANLTQDDLAGMADVDSETISRIERGSVVPSLQRLLVIAEALGVGVADLVQEASPIPSDQVHRLVGVMESLPDRDRKLLLDFAELLGRRVER